MTPIVNLEETPGKTVGRTLPPADPQRASLTIEQSRAWARTTGGIRVPRGVHRFRTHEEADAWLWKMITRPRE